MSSDHSKLTLSALASLAGVPHAFADEAVQEGLVKPDKGGDLYRQRLVGWLKKLHTLRAAGYRWEDIRAWTQRRWDAGHEHERIWPTGRRL